MDCCQYKEPERGSNEVTAQDQIGRGETEPFEEFRRRPKLWITKLEGKTRAHIVVRVERDS